MSSFPAVILCRMPSRVKPGQHVSRPPPADQILLFFRLSIRTRDEADESLCSGYAGFNLDTEHFGPTHSPPSCSSVFLELVLKHKYTPTRPIPEALKRLYMRNMNAAQRRMFFHFISACCSNLMRAAMSTETALNRTEAQTHGHHCCCLQSC